MKRFINLFLIVLAISFSFCSNKKQDEEKAASGRLELIRKNIETNNWNTAKTELDSIHILYPRLVDKRREAQALKDTIERRELARTIEYCDSILPIKIQKADSLQKGFVFEKNDKYQDTGHYVYKTQTTEKNAERSYLRVTVDENADLYMVSNYLGSKKINHNEIEANAHGVFAVTNQNTDLIFRHDFKDDGVYREAVTFKNEAAEPIIKFIAQYALDNVKIKLKGNSSYTYSLTTYDKKAIAETYNLWVVKKDVKRLEKEIEKAKLKILNIKKRYPTADTL